MGELHRHVARDGSVVCPLGEAQVGCRVGCVVLLVGSERQRQRDGTGFECGFTVGSVGVEAEPQLLCSWKRNGGCRDIGVARASELHVRMEAFAGERL